MIQLIPLDDRYAVILDRAPLGTVTLYDNPYHAQNCYVKLELAELDPAVAAPLFEQLQQIAKRPLQVMTPSDDETLIRFLKAGGFACKRKCYEVEACPEDFTGKKPQQSLLHTRQGLPAYTQCCRLLFEHYRATHKAINPWTADFQTFCSMLPKEVVYLHQNDKILHLAFGEENEIAYIYSSDPSSFPDFAAGVIGELFASYDQVFFEADDCDWAAMELRAMFSGQSEDSFDTYIR